MVLRPGRRLVDRWVQRLRFGGLGAVLLSYLRDYEGPEGLSISTSSMPPFFLSEVLFVLVMLTEEVESQNEPMSGFVNLGL